MCGIFGYVSNEQDPATKTSDFHARTYDAANGWFVAEGIPITPYDDAGNKNYYPMFRLTARDAAGSVLATTDIVLPVSDEMSCKSCHASGSGPMWPPNTG